MRDPFDETLADAGRLLRDDHDVDAALAVLVTARASEAKSTAKPRHTQKIAPVIAIGVALAVASGGAVAATQWGPWTYVTQPDIVVARDWSDINGNYLGSCESRMSVHDLPAEAYGVAIRYLNSIDVDSIEPDPEWIAGLLHAIGRVDEVGRLVPGAVPSDFDASGNGWHGPVLAYFADARVLHQALSQAIYSGMANEVLTKVPGTKHHLVGSKLQIQCTTDPGRTGEG